MLSISFIRKNEALIRKAIVDKYIDLDLDMLLAKDEERMSLMRRVEVLRAERNVINNALKDLGKISVGKANIVENGRSLKKKISEAEHNLFEVQSDLNVLMAKVPNITSWDTPVGKGDEDNCQTPSLLNHLS